MPTTIPFLNIPLVAEVPIFGRALALRLVPQLQKYVSALQTLDKHTLMVLTSTRNLQLHVFLCKLLCDVTCACLVYCSCALTISVLDVTVGSASLSADTLQHDFPMSTQLIGSLLCCNNNNSYTGGSSASACTISCASELLCCSSTGV